MVSPERTVVELTATDKIRGGALGGNRGIAVLAGTGAVVSSTGRTVGRGVGDAVGEAVGDAAGDGVGDNLAFAAALRSLRFGGRVGRPAAACSDRAQPARAIVANASAKRRGFTARQGSRPGTGFRLKTRRTARLMSASSTEHPLLSVVVPMYNEQGNVAPLLERIATILETLPDAPSYEIVLVDDGSTDATIDAIRDEMSRRRHLVLASLSRNFGHQLAATAGLELAAGDAVILMDGDLQDPPELIAEFVERWRAGYDVVYAVRRSRKGESAFKLFTARFFYRIIKRLTKVAIPVDTGDFRLMSRRVVEALRRSPERHRFLRGMVSWVGYRQTGVEYDRDERHSGHTKYPLPKMMRFAIDGITSFSDIPLRFASYFGFTVSALAFLYALIVVVAKLFRVYPPGYTPGWASTIVAVVFLGGVQLISLGILGEYLGRIYDEVKARPLYLIADIERS
jgi:glycosyltransferase involved in cell wall biosynthesis